MYTKFIIAMPVEGYFLNLISYSKVSSTLVFFLFPMLQQIKSFRNDFIKRCIFHHCTCGMSASQIMWRIRGWVSKTKFINMHAMYNKLINIKIPIEKNLLNREYLRIQWAQCEQKNRTSSYKSICKAVFLFIVILSLARDRTRKYIKKN